MKTVVVLACSALLLAPGSVPRQASAGNDTFVATQLTAREVNEILSAVARSAFDTPESWRKELRVTRIDLGTERGLVLQGTQLLCGATGNCQLFVFRKAHGHWVSLFGDEPAPTGESFEFGPERSHGIKNLRVSTNTSAEMAERATYAFDGRIYRRQVRPARF